MFFFGGGGGWWCDGKWKKYLKMREEQMAPFYEGLEEEVEWRGGKQGKEKSVCVVFVCVRGLRGDVIRFLLSLWNKHWWGPFLFQKTKTSRS